MLIAVQVQRRTPPHLVGRVDSALTLAATVPEAVSIGAGAALIAVVNYHLLLIVMAVVTAASVACLLAEPDSARAAGGESPAAAPAGP